MCKGVLWGGHGGRGGIRRGAEVELQGLKAAAFNTQRGVVQDKVAAAEVRLSVAWPLALNDESSSLKAMET